VTDDGSGTVDSALSTVLMVAVHDLVVGSQREERRDGEPAAQPDRQGNRPVARRDGRDEISRVAERLREHRGEAGPRDIPTA
jgi:hypothetical protein